MMKYQCCKCEFVFQCSEAIDGYAEGYNAGFLCPSCKANIKELFKNGDKKRLTFESEAHKKWVSRIPIFGLVVFFILYVLSNGSWVTFAGTLLSILGYIVFGLLNNGYKPYPCVIGTETIKD